MTNEAKALAMLQGVRILSFTQFLLGPAEVQYLAGHRASTPVRSSEIARMPLTRACASFLAKRNFCRSTRSSSERMKGEIKSWSAPRRTCWRI